MRVLLTVVLMIGLCGSLACSFQLPGLTPAKNGELVVAGMVSLQLIDGQGQPAGQR